MPKTKIIEQTDEWAFDYTDKFGKPPSYQEYAEEALRLFAIKSQQDIHNLLFDKQWHKHHKEALIKCIDIIEDRLKQEVVE